MPMNYHEKKVIYESFEGLKEIYVCHANFEDNHVLVRHYPNYNEQAFLHEDEVARMRSKEMEIPLNRVYAVKDIEI